MLLRNGGARRHTRVAVLAVLVLIAGYLSLSWGNRPTDVGRDALVRPAQAHHPIDDLVRSAQASHQRAVAERTTNVEDGAAAYRRRRGRNPPPGFDKWYARALRDHAIVVESFFDQIYEDLAPFYGQEPGHIRESGEGWDATLQVRKGKVIEPEGKRFRKKIWAQLLGRLAGELPDMDVAINVLDEPRVLVPWEKINASMAGARSLNTGGQSSGAAIAGRETARAADKAHWITSGSVWDAVQQTCPLASAARPSEEREIFPANLTRDQDPCTHRELAEMHGALIEPTSLSVTQELVPFFSDSKIAGYNDILLPPASYYSDDPLFGSGSSWWPWSAGFNSVPWQSKKAGVVWRGKATGGTVRPDTWKRFHRQRLVSMLNATDATEHLDGKPNLWPADTASAPDASALGAWLKNTADVGFTDFFCPPSDASRICQEMAAAYRHVPGIKMKDQYHWKYLLDIDGNGHSGRFRAFLFSNSAVMKATIFKEWHDSRLVPWVHYIPISMHLHGLWATMSYFIGFGDFGAHDAAGERIAAEGREWATKVLRKQDMELYTYRLLLEYARLCDDNRDSLGYRANL